MTKQGGCGMLFLSHFLTLSFLFLLLTMPNKQNAKKALRQAKKRAAVNAMFKDAYKEATKAAKKTVAAGKDAKEALRLAQKALDKAAKRGVIKANTAARRLSRLMAQAKKAVK